jgi:hypothetical protein
MTWSLLLALAVSARTVHQADSGVLPHCSNRTINEVVRRSGCTLGDDRCWNRSKGFCTDFVEQRLLAATPSPRLELRSIALDELQPGDVAVFAGRAHYAIVERVTRDPNGRPVSIDLAEFNNGRCWVDKDAMVTDTYGVLGRRTSVPVDAADGGFMRARPAIR